MIHFEQGDVDLREVIGHSEEDLATALEAMESSMDFGEAARVTICTESLPADQLLDNLYLGMVACGCHVSQPTARLVEGVPTTEFVLRKGSPAWTMLIPLLIPLGTMGLVAFGITKIETISRALVPLLLVTVGGLIILAAVLSKPATKYIERGGKLVPSTKRLARTASKTDGQQRDYYRELAGRSPKPGWIKAPKAGRDPFSGWEYPKGTWVIYITQDMFDKELPPFIKNQYVLPWSYEEMIKEMAHYYKPKRDRLLYQPSTSKKVVAAR